MPAMDYEKVADLYDVYVATTFDVPFFLEETKGAKSVLELMAGTGRLSIPLAEAGVSLTCVDSSAAMLTILRRKLGERGVSAEVIEMDVAALRLDRVFDRIYLPFHSFAELIADADQVAALRGARRCLGADGRFVCPLHNPGARIKELNGSVRLVGRFPLEGRLGELGDSVALSSAATYDAASGIVRGVQVYEFLDGEGVTRTRRSVDLQYRLVEAERFQEMAGEAGFEVAAVYGDYARSPFDKETSPFMIWVLKAGEGSDSVSTKP